MKTRRFITETPLHVNAATHNLRQADSTEVRTEKGPLSLKMEAFRKLTFQKAAYFSEGFEFALPFARFFTRK